MLKSHTFATTRIRIYEVESLRYKTLPHAKACHTGRTKRSAAAVADGKWEGRPEWENRREQSAGKIEVSPA